MNQLNLVFGPRIPDELDAVGLSFVAAPTMRPDFAIGALSAQRYVQNNFDHVEEDIPILSELIYVPTESIRGKKLTVSVGKSPISGLTNSSNLGADVWTSSDVTLTEEDWNFRVPHEAIEVLGVSVSKANTWRPIIKPGVVWRPYIMLGSTEPGTGTNWIRRAIPEPASGEVQTQYIVLIYSVPEVRYGSETGGQGLEFPPDPARYKQLKQIAEAGGPNKISFKGPIHAISNITVNGSSYFSSGLYTGVEDDDYIKGIDFSLNTIDVSRELQPDDYIEITYLVYADFYHYSGYRDNNDTWYTFDANPEYGHYISNPSSGTTLNSAAALLDKVTLYAIPSAVLVPTFEEDTTDSNRIGTLTLAFYRGLDYGETHFVRHIVTPGDIREDIAPREGSTVANSWGYAIAGRNYYDENLFLGGDRFSREIPYMMPLGRFVLGAPPAITSISNADIRNRGGGVPEDYPEAAVESEAEGIDKMKGFLDLGIWEGKAVKDGGVVEIKIDSSILTTDQDNTDPNKFLASEIDTIVKRSIPPGIDYEVVYEDI